MERGADMQALIETRTGEPCPCVQGRGCPLLIGLSNQEVEEGVERMPA